MDRLNIMKNMIVDASRIVSEDMKIKNKKGYDYNIFTLLDLERQEYGIHEKMIYNILNFPYNKRLSTIFIKKFMEVMQMPASYIESEWYVEKEYATIDYGRMDLFFQSKGDRKENRKCVVIELKIDAQDQEEQLSRYDEFVNRKLGIQDYQIIYITLDGHEASEQSIGAADISKIKDRISYYEYIKKWLDACIEICKEESIDDSFIKQYSQLIEKLHGDDEMEKKIDKLMLDKEELLAAMEIANALPRVKTKVLKTFMNRLKSEFSSLRMKPIYEDIDEAAERYFQSSTVPCLTYFIKAFECSTYGRVSVVLEVCIEHELEYTVAYYDDNLNYIKSSDFKCKQKRRASIIEEAITEVFGIVVRDNQYSSIIYKPILDKNDHKYDFKHFSQSCCNLIDDNECSLEVDRIVRQMVSYIKSLKNELKEL